jgi:protein-tyrosine phosphatase
MEYLTASLKVLYDRVFILFNSRDIPDFVTAESEKEEKEYIDKEYIDKEDINNIGNIIVKTEPYLKQDLVSLNNNRIYDQLSTIQQISWFFTEPTHIIDNIYIGSAHNAANKNLLDRLQIKYVINVTAEITNYFEDEIEYANYTICDDNKQSIFNYLDESYTKIKQFQRKNNGFILIHCFMGASRSATILAHYLIKEKKMDVKGAYDFLKNKRNLVNPTHKFYKELYKMSVKHV